MANKGRKRGPNQGGNDMKNIMLATDLGPNSDRAMERELKLAKEQRSTLHVVHVAAAPSRSNRQKDTSDDLKDIETFIQASLDNYKDTKDIKTNVIVKQGGEVFFEILEAAYANKAELIVIGTHGKERFRDLFVGTTIERLIRKGIIPVLMVKEKPVGSYKNILNAIDFAPCSRGAMRLAMGLAPKASFTVGHVVILPTVTISAHGASAFVHEYVQESAEKSARQHMKAFLKTEATYLAKNHGGKEAQISGKFLDGGMASSLSKSAKNIKADLITIGTHSQPEFTSKLGGTAGDVLAKPPCDVLVTTELMQQ